MQKKLFILLCISLVIGGLIRTYLHPPLTERTTQLEQIMPAQPVRENTVTGSSLPYEIVTVATGLQVPRAVVQTSDERLLVTERPGRVRQIIA